MFTTVCMCLVIVAFFSLVLHSIQQEEQRKADRRQQDLPHAVERRKGGDRRRKSLRSQLNWALKARWSRLVK